jgi:predicted SAM-dependent methyltransferase
MPRGLHIGGTIRVPGWEVLNIQPDECVDHVGSADDLLRFQDASFDAIYASHVLEHMSPDGALQRALKEWHRVLRPAGRLMVAVPDLQRLCGLFSDPSLSVPERYTVMLMMFGGHDDPFDCHEIGFDVDILAYFLREAGFVNMRRVESFGLFSDSSELMYRNVRISLNLTAEKMAQS